MILLTPANLGVAYISSLSSRPALGSTEASSADSGSVIGTLYMFFMEANPEARPHAPVGADVSISPLGSTKISSQGSGSVMPTDIRDTLPIHPIRAGVRYSGATRLTVSCFSSVTVAWLSTMSVTFCSAGRWRRSFF